MRSILTSLGLATALFLATPAFAEEVSYSVKLLDGAAVTWDGKTTYSTELPVKLTVLPVTYFQKSAALRILVEAEEFRLTQECAVKKDEVCELIFADGKKLLAIRRHG